MILDVSMRLTLISYVFQIDRSLRCNKYFVALDARKIQGGQRKQKLVERRMIDHLPEQCGGCWGGGASG